MRKLSTFFAALAVMVVLLASLSLAVLPVAATAAADQPSPVNQHETIMPTFDVTAHPLLSATASALDAAQLAAHNRIAEQALGLAGAALTGDDFEAAQDAVALQVNYQVGPLSDRDDGALIEEGDLVFLAGKAPGDVAVSPLALRMAARLVGAGRRRPVASVRVPAVADDDKPFPFEIT